MKKMSRKVTVVLVLVLCFAAHAQAADKPATVSTTTLRHQTSNLLRLEATTKNAAAKQAAATALCDLYVVLRSDSRYPESDMLQGDAAKLRRRLMSIARRREIQLGRQGIERPATITQRVETLIQESLSQPLAKDRTTNTRLGASAAGPFVDSGWELVELIERIIAPDFWDQRGGSGTVHYFAMRRILVVRATSDVHEQIKELLMALR